MITVKQVFSKAFGEVPEGATCHVKCTEDETFYPTIFVETKGVRRSFTETLQWFNAWSPVDNDAPIEPDIADRPASAFRSFFGSEYDTALDELEGAE